MTIQQKVMTADELFRLPDDGMRHELVRGELRTMAPAGAEHGAISSRIDRSLGSYVEAHGLGEVLIADPGFRLETDPDTVRAPDVAFIQRDRLLQGGLPRGFFPGAPDLAVEVISPTDLYTEVDEKVAEWLERGARAVLVVNPRRRTVAVHRQDQPLSVLGEQDVLELPDLVPGWSLPVGKLFG